VPPNGWTRPGRSRFHPGRPIPASPSEPVRGRLVEDCTDVEDRRCLQLSLTPRASTPGHRDRRDRTALYYAIDTASEGLDTDAVLQLLHNLIDTLPAGKALNKRLDLDATTRTEPTGCAPSKERQTSAAITLL
jgi:hypothetical protein